MSAPSVRLSVAWRSLDASGAVEIAEAASRRLRRCTICATLGVTGHVRTASARDRSVGARCTRGLPDRRHPAHVARATPRSVLGRRYPRGGVTSQRGRALAPSRARRQVHVEITCPRWDRAHHAGLIVHESLRTRRHRHDGRSTASRSRRCERTIFDLCAGVVGPTTVDIAIDHALRRRTHDAGRARRESSLGWPVEDAQGQRSSAPCSSCIEPTPAHAPRARRKAPRPAPHRRARPPAPVPQYEIRRHRRLVRRARRPRVPGPARSRSSTTAMQHHLGTEALDRDSVRRNAIAALGLHGIRSRRLPPTCATAGTASHPTCADRSDAPLTNRRRSRAHIDRARSTQVRAEGSGLEEDPQAAGGDPEADGAQDREVARRSGASSR